MRRRRCFTGRMLVMAACGLMLLVGVALSYRWRSYYLTQPDWATHDPPTSSEGVDRPWLFLLWLISVGVLTGFTVGALVVGPGGRLVMRLLAATSPESKGFKTEAQETVGRITLSGTIGFIIFAGLAFGVAADSPMCSSTSRCREASLAGSSSGLPSWSCSEATSTRCVRATPTSPSSGLAGGSGLHGSGGTDRSGDRPRRWPHSLRTVGSTGKLGVVAGALGPVHARLFAAEPVAFVVPVLGSAVFLAVAASRRLRELLHRGRTVAVVVLTGAVVVSLPAFLSALGEILTLP
jgi:hypothetical protein